MKPFYFKVTLLSLPALVLASLAFTAAPALATGDLNHPNAGECTSAAEQSPGFAELPDCRRYELVTPAEKNGAFIGAVFNGFVPPQIAASGQRVIALSLQCIADAPACHASGEDSEGEPYEFERTAAGWVTHPLAPAAASFERNVWRSVNAEAATALFFVPSVDGSLVEDLYARSEGAIAGESVFASIGPFADPALVSPSPRHGLVEEVEPEGVIATSDLSHVVYEPKSVEWSFDHVAEAFAKPGEADTLYEYVGTNNSEPLLVNVRGGVESHELISVCGAQLGAGGPGSETHEKLYGAMSEDGRVVFFTPEGRHPGSESQCEKYSSVGEAPAARELYARVDGETENLARSVRISAPTLKSSEGCSGVCVVNASSEVDARDAVFSGAATDGSRVFFLDTQQLTNGASESAASAYEGCVGLGGPGGCNLYESVCEGCQSLDAADEEQKRELVDVSAGAGPEGPRVQGVVAIASDGSHVYFVARGVLTGGEENGNGEKAEEEAENLYVYAAGHATFVARLSALDKAEWHGGNLIANVSSDGGLLVFTSHRALTAGDMREEGEEAAQVFEYNAATRVMTRVSIGEEGFDENGNGGTGNASIVGPEQAGVAGGSVPMRSDPTMSDDGEYVFFESPIGLTAGAVNDVRDGNASHKVGRGLVQNVYEYHDRHVYLISDGKDLSEQAKLPISPVELLGSDASGANVFFATYDQLVPEDTDTLRDYYDAHVCSEAEPCVPPAPAPVPCEGEACQGAPSASSVFGAPGGTATFSGAGNLAPPAAAPPKPKTTVKKITKCRKGFVKNKRGKCIRRKQAKRPSNNRRAGR